MRMLLFRFFLLVASFSIGLITQLNAVSAVEGEAPCGKQPDVVFVSGYFRLDPICVYSSEFRIETSGVTLDCQGALLNGDGLREFAVRIDSKGATLTDVTVKNCKIDNFKVNGVLITWGGGDRSKLQSVGNDSSAMYKKTPSRVTIDNVSVTGSGHVGIYIDDFVSDTVVMNSIISDSGGSGIYLEHDTKNIQILHNTFTRNGTALKREAISVDSSFDNLIEDNTFFNDGMGGVFLYKNCGEKLDTDPESIIRTHAASGNRLRNNQFDRENVAIWIASRQSRNLKNWGCGDTPLADGFYRDRADSNIIDSNTIKSSVTGIIVEDDRNVIVNNTIVARQSCVKIGSLVRKNTIDSAIQDTVIRKNTCDSTEGQGFLDIDGGTVAAFTDNIPNVLQRP